MHVVNQWLESRHFEAESRAFIGFYKTLPDKFKVVEQNDITEAAAKVNPKVNSTSEMSFFSTYRHDFYWDGYEQVWTEDGAGCDIGFPTS